MTRTQYEHVAQLISRIRNARFGEMVTHTEELIDSQEWRGFTTPAGTQFTFLRCEFDYFLAAQELDPVTIRTAYAKAGLPRQVDRLADITGRGKKPADDDRRKWQQVADKYRMDPSGAGARIEGWARSGEAVVTDTAARTARTPQLRKQYEATGRLPSLKQRWHVDWRDESKTTAQAIAERLLKDPELAHEVYKILHSRVVNDYQKKRRSVPQNGVNGPDQEGG